MTTRRVPRASTSKSPAAPWLRSSWLGRGWDEDGSSTLPPRGLTLVQLGSAEPGGAHGDWATAVLPVAAALIGLEQSVFFVEFGGYNADEAGPVVASACGGSVLLRVHDDEDVVVRCPPPEPFSCPRHGRSGTYGRMACIPSLDNIAVDLQEHDAAYGQSVVIFDDILMLRPYSSVTDTEGPAPYKMPRDLATQWLAYDLRKFPGQREAATIAVMDPWPGWSAALEMAVQVSLLHVVVLRQPGSDTVDITMRRRGSLQDPWPSSTDWRRVLPTEVPLDVYADGTADPP